jgi:hypothetical protein
MPARATGAHVGWSGVTIGHAFCVIPDGGFGRVIRSE